VLTLNPWAPALSLVWRNKPKMCLWTWQVILISTFEFRFWQFWEKRFDLAFHKFHQIHTFLLCFLHCELSRCASRDGQKQKMCRLDRCAKHTTPNTDESINYESVNTSCKDATCVDSCNVSVAAVQLQHCETNEEKIVTCSFSKKITASEHNLDSHHKSAHLCCLEHQWW